MAEIADIFSQNDIIYKTIKKSKAYEALQQ